MSSDRPFRLSDVALKSLTGFGLLEALFGRRSRRFGLGMTIPDGPQAYTSRHKPVSVSEQERLLLILVGAGISGWNLGIPHTSTGDRNSGCNYTVRPVGRTYPSGAATHGSEILVTDDSGSFITQFRDLDATRMREFEGGADLERLAEFLAPHIVRLRHERVTLPAEWPHITAHNQWVANRPGTTLFVPIADQVDSFFNFLWALTAERCPLLDTRSGRLLGDAEAFIREGRLDRDRATPLSVVEDKSRISTTTETSIAAYNMHLVMQAMGLGGWLLSGINTHSLLGGARAPGVKGFGLRFEERADWVQPNPIGIDGLFEPLVPPYVPDMHEGARRFADRKLGPGGNFDPMRPGPYRENDRIKALAERFDARFTAYVGSVAQDIYQTYGRFPATLPTVACTVYTQAQHIDLDFYDEFYKEGAYLPEHRDHFRIWHGSDTDS